MPICVSSLHTGSAPLQDHHGGGHLSGVKGQTILSWGSIPTNFFYGFEPWVCGNVVLDEARLVPKRT
jgi:hypothetical protein